MPGNNGAPDPASTVRVGRDNSGIIVAGTNNTVTNLQITAEYGAEVTVHAGPLPVPVKRQPISQLPRSAAEPLIGREHDVRRLHEAIVTRQVVHIWGPPGIGKSALLRHLARTVPRGPEGVAYVEAGGRTADDIAQAIFDISFDAPNYKPSLEVIREHLKTLRLRVYLDGVEFAEAEQRKLFDLASLSTFVVTSRQRSVGSVAQSFELRGLSDAAAVELVRSLLGRALQPDEEATVAALRDKVAGNPLELRRIACSGNARLPGIDDLPELLPNLVRRLSPQESDLLHLLASLSGAELTGGHLDELLRPADAVPLADGLVRRGLLLASEGGYSCPPDIAARVLKLRGNNGYPADRLCRTLTGWVSAPGTTPDEVAAHFRALDFAVLRAEATGFPDLGVALARAAFPKLARSRQFDAWGCLLGTGWSAARTAGDKASEAFFQHAAAARKKSLGGTVATMGLALEAATLWHELEVLRAHATAQRIANTAATHVVQPSLPGVANASSTSTTVGHSAAATHHAGTTFVVNAGATGNTPPVVMHPTAAVARPVVNMSHLSPAPHAPVQVNLAQAHPATQAIQTSQPLHAAATNSVAHVPPRIDLSHTAHLGAGGSHTTATVATATAAKSATALAISCVIGFTVVAGVGASIYANDRSNPTPSVATAPIPTLPTYPNPVFTVTYPPTTDPATPSPTFDPVCGSYVPQVGPEVDQYNAVVAGVSDPSGAAVSESLSDLSTIISTLQSALNQAQDGSVISNLKDMLSHEQEIQSELRAYQDGTSQQFDSSVATSQFNTAWDTLQSDCGI